MITNKKPLLYFIFDFRIFAFIVVRKFFVIGEKTFFYNCGETFFIDFFYIFARKNFFFIEVSQVAPCIHRNFQRKIFFIEVS